MGRRKFVAIITGCLALGGCDPAPLPAPPATAPSSAAVEAEVRPTTQALLTGDYKSFSLPGIPLHVQAPASWTFTQAGPLTMLEGPTPVDHAAIAFNVRETVPLDRFASLVARLQTESMESGSKILRAEVRMAGNVQILDRQISSKSATIVPTDVNGVPTAGAMPIAITPLHWTMTYFVPVGDGFERYELNFVGLTAEQYEADKDFLEKIIRSVRLTGESPV